MPRRVFGVWRRRPDSDSDSSADVRSSQIQSKYGRSHKRSVASKSVTRVTFSLRHNVGRDEAIGGKEKQALRSLAAPVTFLFRDGEIGEKNLLVVFQYVLLEIEERYVVHADKLFDGPVDAFIKTLTGPRFRERHRVFDRDIDL